MKLRKSFLLVGGSLAASSIAMVLLVACSSDNPGAESSNPSSGGDSGGSNTTGDGSNTGKDGANGDGGEEGEGGNLDGSKGPDGAKTKICLQDLDGGTTATCPANGCSAACNDVLTNYKPGIAQYAVECIAKLPSCTAAPQVRSCVDEAVAQVCSDSTSDAYCSPLVMQCDPPADSGLISENGCVAVANSLTSTGRQVFASCIQGKVTAGDCAHHVADCFNTIRQ